MAHIVSIAYKPEGIESRPADRFARLAVSEAVLVAGCGISGDRKGKGDDRHLNVMCRETLDHLHHEHGRIEPGEMGEQIVLEGVVIDALPPGTRLRFGESALIEVAKPRTPCSRFEQVRKITIKAAWGRLGVMARVIRGGVIRIGDAVEISTNQ